MKVSFRVDGGRALADALRTLPARVSRSFQREALTEVAEPMRAQMASMAPRAPGEPDMADHMIISRTLARDETSDTEVGVRVGPDGKWKRFFYAFFQEWGTARHAPRPFMRPAFDTHVRQIPAKLAAIVWRALAGRGVSRPTQMGTGPMQGGPGGRGL
jgi:HK97 gp10 family phage protein